MSDIIYLSNVRLSFPKLIEPDVKVDPKTNKNIITYSCDLLMPKDHPGFKQFMTKYNEMALEKWGTSVQMVMNMINNDRRFRCYGSGDEKLNQKTFEVYTGYAGNVYIRAARFDQPQIFQPDGNKIDNKDTLAYNHLTRDMYAGCNVNAAIKPWLQDNTHGRGSRCELIAIQFAGDNEPLGSAQLDVSSIFSPSVTPEVGVNQPTQVVKMPWEQ